MATDFWASSHYKRWVVDRATLKQARADDLQYVDDPDHLDFLAIYFGNAISKLGKKLGLRQRVIATATMFFRRFYLKNSYCETDPFIVISACCYVAAKAEESPIHIKNVVSESRSLFSQEIYNTKHFPSDHTKLAEMEFYLVDDLECDLVVFHPYRTLLTLCKKDNEDAAASYFSFEEGEEDEVGAGIGSEDGPRYWGTGEGRLELTEDALQTAWFIINDTYRSDLCLLHPPHIIAIAALYLTFTIHSPSPTQTQPSPSPNPTTAPALTPQPQPQPHPRRSSRQHPPAEDPKPEPKPQDPISFFAELNVSLPLVATAAQEIISLYTLWERYKESGGPEFGSKGQQQGGQGHHQGSVSPAKRSSAGTPMDVDEGDGEEEEQLREITPKFLSRLLMRMREARIADMAHPANGRPLAVNKLLERTQAAG